ncbi:sn-glycerol-3-phosphate ABC transporter ATP-binding protein UgpC [Desulfovibrio sp. OttesenSCG-928-I05]|nr:sn-glycerol-3-phosphate ABC transporter ATP-binding protein UgpC [Desulfovibrio sp. OttesenSCG-928-I05]
MAQVELRNIIKNFGKNPVIKGVTQVVPDGTFLVIVGPSGCGKSTVLRLIAGLEELTDGQILIGDRDVGQLEPKERDVAMVFQNYALYPHMNVRDNMSYGLRVRGVPKEEQEKRIALAADMLGLSEFLDRTPRQLSGGQRQRVAMGRAIVREPSVFLFDEPLSNLDASLRNQMRVELRRLHERLGTTSIYVTHDQVEAMTLAKRIMVMNLGLVEQFGTPDDVYLRPASVFVARFIGSPSMNILRARLTDGKLVFPDGRQVEFSPAEDQNLAGHDLDVLFGIRPEDFIPVPESGPNTIPCRVELIEALGADTLVYCSLAKGQESMVRTEGEMLIARLEGTVRPEPGALLNMSVRPGRVHVFDAATQKRL